jgi:hypothetical protein
MSDRDAANAKFGAGDRGRSGPDAAVRFFKI